MNAQTRAAKAFVYTHRIVCIRLGEGAAGERDDVIVEAAFALDKNGAQAGSASVRVDFCSTVRVKVPGERMG